MRCAKTVGTTTFIQPAIAGLGVAELALDHAEDMLDLGAEP